MFSVFLIFFPYFLSFCFFFLFFFFFNDTATTEIYTLSLHDALPIDVTIEACVLPHYVRGEITAHLRDVFSNRQLADGTLGFFHPDRLTFGQGIYLSQIVAAATSVEGVETARVATLTRRDGLGGSALETGVLTIGALEVAQCDSDPNFPERGKLTLQVRGGR